MTTYFGESGWEDSGGTDITDNSVWAGTYGNAPSVYATTPNSGTYCARSNLSADSGGAVIGNFTATGEVFVRGYYRFSALPASGQWKTVYFTTVRDSDTIIAQVGLTDQGSGPQWVLWYMNGSYVSSLSSMATPSANTYYDIELRVKCSGSVAEYQVWIDETELTDIAKTNCNSVSTTVNNFLGGVQWTDYAVEVLFDDFIAGSALNGATGGSTPTYTITPSDDAHSTITPGTEQTVNQGSNKSFNISADANYHISQILVDGNPVSITSVYTFTNVIANHTIDVSSAPGDPPVAEGFLYSGLGGDYLFWYGVYTPLASSADAWDNDFTTHGYTKSWAEWAGFYEGWKTARLGFCFTHTAPYNNIDHSVMGTAALDAVIDYFEAAGARIIIANFDYGNTYWTTQAFWDNWIALTNYYKTGGTNPNYDTLVAFEIYNEMFTEQEAGWTKAQIVQRWADLTVAIHTIDPNRVVIFPTGQLHYTSCDQWLTDVYNTGILSDATTTLTNTIFDVTHPYYFENSDDEGMTPEQRAYWYKINWLDPSVAAFGASRCYMGETFRWMDASYTVDLQERWIDTWIRYCIDAGVSFCLYAGLAVPNTMNAQIDEIISFQDVYPGEPVEPTPIPDLDWVDYFSDLTYWTTINGTWVTASNVLTGTTADNVDGMIIAGDISWTNYVVQAIGKISTGVDNKEIAIVVDYQNNNNFYWAGLGVYGYEYAICRRLNGADTVLASSGTVDDVDVDTVYEIVVSKASTHLVLIVDSDLKLSVLNATSFNNGKVGLRTWDSEIQVTQFNVSLLGGPETNPLSGTIAPATSAISTSDTKDLVLSITGGTGPYDVVWKRIFEGSESTVRTQNDVYQDTYTFPNSSAGIYTIYAVITDDVSAVKTTSTVTVIVSATAKSGWSILYLVDDYWEEIPGAMIDENPQELSGHEEAVIKIPNNVTNRAWAEEDQRVRILWQETMLFDGIAYGSGNCDTHYLKPVLYNYAYEKMKKAKTSYWVGFPVNAWGALLDICTDAGVDYYVGTDGVDLIRTNVIAQFDDDSCWDAFLRIVDQCIVDNVPQDYWYNFSEEKLHVGVRGSYKPYFENIMGQWLFDEGTGTAATQTSQYPWTGEYAAYTRAGTLAGSPLPSWVTGKFGTALQFDGSQNYVYAVVYEDEFAPASAGTICFWLYVSGTVGSAGYPVDKGINNSGMWGFIVNPGTPETIQFKLLTNGGMKTTDAGIELPKDQWVHVAATWSTSLNGARLYLNGTQVGYVSLGGSTPVDTIHNAVTMGCSYNGTTQMGFLACKVDEVRIYEAELTANQISRMSKVGNNFTILRTSNRNIDRSQLRTACIIKGTDENGNKIAGTAYVDTYGIIQIGDIPAGYTPTYKIGKSDDLHTATELGAFAAKTLYGLIKETASSTLSIPINQAVRLQPGDTIDAVDATYKLNGNYKIYKINYKLTEALVEIDRRNRRVSSQI